jgi:hypothetical protein
METTTRTRTGTDAELERRLEAHLLIARCLQRRR